MSPGPGDLIADASYIEMGTAGRVPFVSAPFDRARLARVRFFIRSEAGRSSVPGQSFPLLSLATSVSLFARRLSLHGAPLFTRRGR